MSLDNQTTLGDYAPHPQRRRVSRGRKALIGLMAIGAFAAVGGAGTFASFTASTDNASGPNTNGDSPFQTGKFRLLNTVMNADGTPIINNGPDQAVTPVTAVTPGVDDAAPCASDRNDAAIGGIATDQHAECDLLFMGEANDVIEGITSYVRLENDGDAVTGNGELTFFVPTDGVCELGVDTGSTLSNCNNVQIQVQEYIGADGVANTPGTGDELPALASGDWNPTGRVPECVFGLTTSNTESDVDATTADNDGVCVGGKPLSKLPQITAGAGGITARVKIAGTFPAKDVEYVNPGLVAGFDTGELDHPDNISENNDVRYFRIRAWMPPIDCGAPTPAASTNGGINFAATFANDAVAPLGIHDNTLVGCHNSKQNTSSQFTLRWMLIG